MTTPITELSLADAYVEALPLFESVEERNDWARRIDAASHAKWSLAREVALAQDMVNRAEARTDAKPEHWKEAQGELTRLRREILEADGEILMLRAELERRVRRVRTGGGT